MVTIDIDGQSYQVNPDENLLQACLSVGLDLPYFCWHPAMGSVGACRQCAVIQYSGPEDETGRLVVGCMTPVTEGMRVSLDNPEASQFRADIIELLMTNHPHDCPVCEEGGQCHLQDMTVMTGHTARNYRGLKRTHTNQYLGPFISHEMNRCIACYRCVRFYQDYAGGRDLGVFSAHNHVYFGRSEEGVLENEFSGNLVEVCPTGVFTDKPYSQNYSRKWDMQTAPSVCTHCSVGCNISPGERYGELRNVVNRYHGEINRYFLCDRGRFGYGFVNADSRVREAQINGEITDKQKAVEHLRGLLKDPTNVIGIGSPRASLESNFVLRRLVGEHRFYSGFSEIEHHLVMAAVDLLTDTSARIPTLTEVEDADAIFILGEDVTNTAPRLALSIRQALRNKGFQMADEAHIPKWQDAAVRELVQKERNPLFIASCGTTPLDSVAEGIYRGTPQDIARLGFAVAAELDASAPPISGLSDEQKSLARSIADALKSAQYPLIVSGTGVYEKAVLEAASNVVKALHNDNQQKDLLLVTPECNSIGLGLMGGHSFSEAKQRLKSGDVETVVILENDLFQRDDAKVIDELLQSAKHVVVVDHTHNETTQRAELVLPAATFAEADGTLINLEGRAQRYFQVYLATPGVQEAWRWLQHATDMQWENVDDVTAACAADLACFSKIVDAAPGAEYRVSGMKIPRQSHRYSGRTAMRANLSVSEPKQPVDTDSALAYSMEGAGGNQPPPALNPGVWAPAWNSNQAINKFQDEIGGQLRGGDPGIRIIESQTREQWFTDIPSAFSAQQGQWMVVPRQHIFGSEELSRLSPSVAERVPPFYISLNPQDAAHLQIKTGDRVMVSCLDGLDEGQIVEVQEDAGLLAGSAGIPCGLNKLRGLQWFTSVALKKFEEDE